MNDEPARLREAAGLLVALSGLLGAGVPVPRAIELLVDEGADAGRRLLAPVRAAAHRQGVAAALTDELARLEREPRRFGAERAAGFGALVAAWRRVAAIWGVAEASGAPLVDALRRLAAGLEGMARAVEEEHGVAAGPRSTARLLQWLPVVGVALGALVGADVLGVLFTTPFGWGCLVAGGALAAAGARWQRRMLRALRPPDASDGLLLLAVELGVRAGRDADGAVALAVRMLHRAGLREDRAVERARLDRLLRLWRRSGVPLVGLLDGERRRLERERSTRLRQIAASLETRLLLPLGVCALPAFIILSVLPMIAAVLGDTLAVLG